MKPRTPLIAANWKMHSAPTEWEANNSPFHPQSGVDVIVFPSMLDLPSCVNIRCTVGAQYGRPEKDGAFTGDVSMEMLAAHGCQYALCGHSERRQHHHESDEFIAEQVEAAIDAGLIPILCIGESADERELGQAEEAVQRQLQIILETLNSKLIIAYEPVWAIGNGKTASAKDAQEMHAFIRSQLPSTIRDDMRIIYGGSVKPTNAAELIAEPDIDGFLVGASSLHCEEFAQIIDTVVAAK